MDKIMAVVGGIIAGCVAFAFGFPTPELYTLLVFIGIDFILGIVCAAVFKASPKTTDGKLESNAMLKGIIRKMGMILVVVLAHRVDVILNVEYIMTAAVYALCSVETLSIVETLSLMGVPIPNVVKKAIEVIKELGEKNGD